MTRASFIANRKPRISLLCSSSVLGPRVVPICVHRLCAPCKIFSHVRLLRGSITTGRILLYVGNWVACGTADLYQHVYAAHDLAAGDVLFFLVPKYS